VRCSRDVRHRHMLGAVVVACILLALVTGATTGTAFTQQADPVTEADQAVAEAQAEVDRVADAYFDALERTRELEARITDLQGRIDELRERVAQLKRITSDRAVAAYKRSGNFLEAAFLDDPGAADTLRRIKVLDLLNAHDDVAVRALHRTQDDLASERGELDAAREKQASAVDRLRQQERQVNATLVEAQNRRQAVIELQLEAQRQAEAAAAAAAAAEEAARAAAQAAAPPAPPPSTATPAPVPSARPANTGVHPQHNHPFLVCVRFKESTNNYQAYNPGGPAYGAYQFLQPTWNLTANRAGRGDLVGLDPRRASEWDQDDMAWTLYQWQGKRPWIVNC
jgi:peptidoglycan hydrolase CwlO-like protein